MTFDGLLLGPNPLVGNYDDDGRDEIWRGNQHGLSGPEGPHLLGLGVVEGQGGTPSFAVETHQAPHPATIRSAAPDIDGDGIAELVHQDNNQVTVNRYAPSSAIGWATTGALSSLSAGGVVYGADLQGDGLQDIVTTYSSDGNGNKLYQAWFSRPDGLFDGSLTPVPDDIVGYPSALDIDGDRKVDVVHVDSTYMSGVELSAGQWSIGALSGAARPRDLPGYSTVSSSYDSNDREGWPVYLDVNGDGNLDVFRPGTNVICINMGFGFGDMSTPDNCKPVGLPEPQSNDPFIQLTYTPGDFDGDGRDDLIVAERHLHWQTIDDFEDKTYYKLQLGVYLSRWQGHWNGMQTFVSVPPPVLPGNRFADTAIVTGDFDGDGRLDVAYNDWREKQGVSNTSLVMALQPRTAPDEFEDRLIAVENGLGLVDEVQYRTFVPETDTESDPVYTFDDSCTYPVKCVRKGPPLVASHTTWEKRGLGYNGGEMPGTRRTRTYRYHGAREDVRGRGWLGFERIEMFDEASDTTVEQFFDQSARYYYAALADYTGYTIYPGVGAPSLTRTTTMVNGYPVTTSSSVERDYDVHDGWYAPRTVRTRQTVEEVGANGSQMATRTTEYEDFDAYHRPRTTVATDAEGGQTTTTVEYLHQPSRWLIGRVTDREVRREDQGEVRFLAESFTYDAAGLAQLLEHELRGDTVDGDYDPTRHRRVSYGYKPSGVLERVDDEDLGTAQIRTTALQYDADDVFVVAAVNPLQHAIQLEHDGRTGRVVRQMDQNCVVAEHHVDLFGRTVASFHADGSSVYYDLLSPYPATGDPDNPDLGVKESVLALHAVHNDGAEQYVYFDSMGRAVAAEHKHFDGTFTRRYQRYDALGRVYALTEPKETVPVHDLDVPPYTMAGVANAFLTSFDNLGRVTERYLPGEPTQPGPAPERWDHRSLWSSIHHERGADVSGTTRICWVGSSGWTDSSTALQPRAPSTRTTPTASSIT